MICTESLNSIPAWPPASFCACRHKIACAPQQTEPADRVTELHQTGLGVTCGPPGHVGAREMPWEFAWRVELWCPRAAMIDLISADFLLVPKRPTIIRDRLFVSNCVMAFHRRHLSYNLPFLGKKQQNPTKSSRKQRGKQYLGDINYPSVLFRALKGGL